ncbi:pirin [Lactiplantibacillus plantarum]|uniref:pirin n=1 Tax=Lactiplantibacillus plantarum TaxID=1590 RepID=UPI001F351DF9|nr:pirin [Lactiplantibacillus plantarum]
MEHIKFNRYFYKTWSFWLGILTIVGLVGDPIVHYQSSISPWIMMVIAIFLFFEAFFNKKS